MYHHWLEGMEHVLKWFIFWWLIEVFAYSLIIQLNIIMLGYEEGNAEKIASLSQFYPDCEQVRRCLAIRTVLGLIAQQRRHVVEHVSAVTMVYHML